MIIFPTLTPPSSLQKQRLRLSSPSHTSLSPALKDTFTSFRSTLSFGRTIHDVKTTVFHEEPYYPLTKTVTPYKEKLVRISDAIVRAGFCDHEENEKVYTMMELKRSGEKEYPDSPFSSLVKDYSYGNDVNALNTGKVDLNKVYYYHDVTEAEKPIYAKKALLEAIETSKAMGEQGRVTISNIDDFHVLKAAYEAGFRANTSINTEVRDKQSDKLNHMLKTADSETMFNPNREIYLNHDNLLYLPEEAIEAACQQLTQSLPKTSLPKNQTIHEIEGDRVFYPTSITKRYVPDKLNFLTQYNTLPEAVLNKIADSNEAMQLESLVINANLSQNDPIHRYSNPHLPYSQRGQGYIQIHNSFIGHPVLGCPLPKREAALSLQVKEAIQESYRQGFSGRVACNANSIGDIVILCKLGFVPQEDYQEKIKTFFQDFKSWDNIADEDIKSLNQKSNKDVFCTYYIPQDKVKDVLAKASANRCLTEKTSSIQYGESNNLKSSERFLPMYDYNRSVKLINFSKEGHPSEHITLQKRFLGKNTYTLMNTTNQNIYIPHRGRLEKIQPGKQCSIELGNNIVIGNELYLMLNDGLTRISAQAKELCSLFPHGIQHSSVKQGQVGDCFFQSSLFVLTKNPIGPAIIADMFSFPNKNDVEITFPDHKDRKVTIKNYKKYMKGDERQQIGVDPGIILLELAYNAYKHGGTFDPKNKYDLIEKGGSPLDALKSLTNGVGFELNLDQEKTLDDYLNPQSPKKKELEGLLNDIADHPARYVCVASALDPAFFDAMKLPPINSQTNSKFQYSPHHAFALLAVDKEKRQVILANPWNGKEMTTKMDYKDFYKYFQSMHAVILPSADNLG